MKKLLRVFLYIAVALSFAACNSSKTSEKVCPILTIEGGQVQGVAADLEDVFV